jgi:hypothetical protein
MRPTCQSPLSYFLQIPVSSPSTRLSPARPWMPRRKAARGGLTGLLHSPTLDPPAPTVEEGAKEAGAHLSAVLARQRGMERREAGGGTRRSLTSGRAEATTWRELVFRPRMEGARPPAVEEATTQGADPHASFELAAHPRRRIPRCQFGDVRLRQAPPHPLPSTARASSARGGVRRRGARASRDGVDTGELDRTRR